MKEITIVMKHSEEQNSSFTGKAKYIGNNDWKNQNQIYRINYFEKGHLHRTDGPACTFFTEDEEVYFIEFYLYGSYVSKEQWFESLTEEQKLEALWNSNEWNQWGQ